MMVKFLLVLFYQIYFLGLFSFSMNRKHLLTTLLSLEMIVLSLFLILFISLLVFDNEFYFLLFFITFSVCEGVIGLSIMVSLVRTHGNDNFCSFNILC
uniref:NADH-ubiquinone oxidoreductase chain 4L n=1 Tax=Tenomerga trabecula TaxID=2843307 RepID=A0A8F0F5S9_9COLE|nr:NADH dehydrogenase subunit 4L [Tenomerga trabecula]